MTTLAVDHETAGALDAMLKECTGLYGSGEPFTHNTYNAESLLSQVLQSTYFELSEPGARCGQAHVLLQVHNGCDVRGSYTAPKAFRVDRDGACIFCSANARIYCEPRSADVPGQPGLNGGHVPPPESHYWQTDDGYHWYERGTGPAPGRAVRAAGQAARRGCPPHSWYHFRR